MRQTRGLGLGLSIVKNLVEMHGGSVSATSEGLGRGSTFTVSLPVKVVRTAGGAADDDGRVHPASVASLAVPPSDVGLLRGVRVLVVDDQDDAREIVRRVLLGAGAEVAVARSAADALEAIPRSGPTVIVSDIGMRDLDGYEFIRRVRMLGAGAGRTPAIALTAFSRSVDRTDAMLAGFQMHLSKPVDPHELVVSVATLAGRI